ncbi:MAG: P-loop NTPase [Chitinispirillia bacterium]|nr:P-loop NTPase [Chitinispirillia bacterium]MCL2184122.1 P-loop NTPase [Chitinispirillia bacterium]MCL2269648.1 P-loop NTPase [Chitinispirillia bacterium]
MSEPVIISVGGGKGGVGKSTVSSNLGAALVRSGYSVGYIDADLGGANLHTCLGMKRPPVTLQNFLAGEIKSLADVAVPTPVPQSWLISGAGEFLELANPNFGQKQKILNGIKSLEADYILVDLGAGSHSIVSDFFAAFPHNITVTDCLPTSIENAYGFLKSGILRGLIRLFPGRNDIQKLIKGYSTHKLGKNAPTLDIMFEQLAAKCPEEVKKMREWLDSRKLFLVLNMVRGKGEIMVGEGFTGIVQKYLSVSLRYIGYSVYTAAIRTSLQNLGPAVVQNDPQMAECYGAISNNLVALSR